MNPDLIYNGGTQRGTYEIPNAIDSAFMTFYGPINVLNQTPSISINHGTLSNIKVKYGNAAGGVFIINCDGENIPAGSIVTITNCYCVTGNTSKELGFSIRYY